MPVVELIPVVVPIQTMEPVPIGDPIPANSIPTHLSVFQFQLCQKIESHQHYHACRSELLSLRHEIYGIENEMKDDMIRIRLRCAIVEQLVTERDKAGVQLTRAIIYDVFGHGLRRPLGLWRQRLLVNRPVEAGQLLLRVPLAFPAAVRRLPRYVPTAEPQSRARRSARDRALAPMTPIAPLTMD